MTDLMMAWGACQFFEVFTQNSMVIDHGHGEKLNASEGFGQRPNPLTIPWSDQ